MGSLSSIIVLLAFIGWMVRPKHQSGGRPGSGSQGLPPEAVDYLDRIDGDLALPPEVRSDIRMELADHLADSIAAIEAEGLDERSATREALARLGNPEELARQMRSAHQTTRRLLAGAAGGVFQAATGAIQGYIFAAVALVVVVALGGSVFKPFVNFLADRFSAVDRQGVATGTALAALMALVAAFTAGRRSAMELARVSRRPVRRVARLWALAGATFLGWLILFVVSSNQYWLAVPIELAIPFAFVAGSIFRVDRPLVGRFGRAGTFGLYGSAAGLVVIAAAGLFLTFSNASGGTDSPGYSWDARILDRIAPAWPTEILTTPIILDESGAPSGHAVFSWQVGGAAALAEFHDLRLEAWRGVPIPGAPDWETQSLPDFSYSAPYAVVTPTLSDGEVTADIDLSHSRTNRWTVFLTGVAPDGVRYRLTDDFSPSCTTTFSGTVWDWVTASN